jgi:MerR family redox-sensitive transcriptional activator SoxR
MAVPGSVLSPRAVAVVTSRYASTRLEVEDYRERCPEVARPPPICPLAERSGLPVSCLHFYQRSGPISSTRHEGNQRRDGRGSLRRLAFIRPSQRVGIPLSDIREALESLPRGRTPGEDDWAELSARWRERLDDQIDQLSGLRDDLATCIGCGCPSFRRCHLINPFDSMGREGPGPRRPFPGTKRPDDTDLG